MWLQLSFCVYLVKFFLTQKIQKNNGHQLCDTLYDTFSTKHVQSMFYTQQFVSSFSFWWRQVSFVNLMSTGYYLVTFIAIQ